MPSTLRDGCVIDRSTGTVIEIPKLLEEPQVPNKSPKRAQNGNTSKTPQQEEAVPKYKHLLAIHSRHSTSCLTQGSGASPSFVGFRNLMVLVICTYINCSKEGSSSLQLTDSIVVSNLRLMIENFRKVSSCSGLPRSAQALTSHSTASSFVYVAMTTDGKMSLWELCCSFRCLVTCLWLT